MTSPRHAQSSPPSSSSALSRDILSVRRLRQSDAEAVALHAPDLIVDSPQADFELRSLMRVLQARYRTIAGTVGACMTIALIVVLQLTPVYSSSTLIMVGQRENKVFDPESILAGLTTDTASIENQIQVLRSSALAERVVKQLNLTLDPEFDPARQPRSWLSNLSPLTWFSPGGRPRSGASHAGDGCRSVAAQALFLEDDGRHPRPFVGDQAHLRFDRPRQGGRDRERHRRPIHRRSARDEVRRRQARGRLVERTLGPACRPGAHGRERARTLQSRKRLFGRQGRRDLGGPTIVRNQRADRSGALAPCRARSEIPPGQCAWPHRRRRRFDRGGHQFAVDFHLARPASRPHAQRRRTLGQIRQPPSPNDRTARGEEKPRREDPGRSFAHHPQFGERGRCRARPLELARRKLERYSGHDEHAGSGLDQIARTRARGPVDANALRYVSVALQRDRDQGPDPVARQPPPRQGIRTRQSEFSEQPPDHGHHVARLRRSWVFSSRSCWSDWTTVSKPAPNSSALSESPISRSCRASPATALSPIALCKNPCRRSAKRFDRSTRDCCSPISTSRPRSCWSPRRRRTRARRRCPSVSGGLPRKTPCVSC